VFSVRDETSDRLLSRIIASCIQGKLSDDADKISVDVGEPSWKLARECSRVGDPSELRWTLTGEDLGTLSWICPLRDCKGSPVTVHGNVTRHACRGIVKHLTTFRHQVRANFLSVFCTVCPRVLADERRHPASPHTARPTCPCAQHLSGGTGLHHADLRQRGDTHDERDSHSRQPEVFFIQPVRHQLCTSFATRAPSLSASSSLDMPMSAVPQPPGSVTR
jgi:hypothetical protein